MLHKSIACVSGIVAVNKVHCIGTHGKLPWSLPEESKIFKTLTTHSYYKPICIMGRKTFESLQFPLYKRTNIVISKDITYAQHHPGITVCKSLRICLHVVQDALVHNVPIFVIGGAEIYTMFTRYISTWYISVVNNSVEGDTYFFYYLSLDFCKKFALVQCLFTCVSFTTFKYVRKGIKGSLC
jgi:dihydrofolate reductase